ncbi:MAG: hypothetical protein H0T62_06475 [Parachlamydiaceae bacterium]|nr:hypothetical protein [Parachlamydiaceae bacterium]
MANTSFIPEIVLCFDPENDHAAHINVVSTLLAKILPKDLFSEKMTTNEKEQFQLLLPRIYSIPCQKTPGKMSFCFLAKYRSNSFKFFFEMISQWLVTGKRLNVVLIHAIDFQMPEVSDEIFTLSDVTILVEDDEELRQILTRLPIIEAEIILGLESTYYARHILEVKDLPPDEKTANIHAHITFLAKRLPHAFDQDLLIEMQHVLVMCKEEFKAARTSRHLGRIISIQYLFRRALRTAMIENPVQRHLSLKLFRSHPYPSKKEKSVLSILVAVSFLRNKELLEKKHLLRAIQNLIPEIQPVENSFFVDKRSMESICTLYLEVERTDGLLFSSEEIKLLREALPKDLKANIEYLMHPVFMPCNEEEIMRNILTLSNEVRYLRDIPQVIINFDEQTHLHLSFSIILVRVLLPGISTSVDLFKKGNSSLEYIFDRSKHVGYLRKKYIKEALVFQVHLPKKRFLRNDHSIDLYKARHSVVTDLSTVLGEFRDFNGGMISKQNELLNKLKDLLGDTVKYDECLLENFFFSLMPVTMRSLLEPEALKTLFQMLLNTIEHGFSTNCSYRIQQDLDFIFILVSIKESQQKEELHRTLLKFNLHSTELAHVTIKAHDVSYEGYIYRCDEPSKQQQFLHAVQLALVKPLDKDF